MLAVPPVQGKAATAHIIRLVESNFFPTDIDQAKVQLRSGGLDRLKDSLVRSAIDHLVFGYSRVTRLRSDRTQLSTARFADISTGNAPSGSMRINAVISVPLVHNIRMVSRLVVGVHMAIIRKKASTDPLESRQPPKPASRRRRFLVNPSAIGVDLFGTLVRPPAGQKLLKMLSEARIQVNTEARRAVANGFFPAIFFDCSDILTQAIHISLTRRFTSLHDYINEVREFCNLPRTPTRAQIEACESVQKFAIEAASLWPGVSELLGRFQRRGVPLVLVSDVSSFWQPVIESLDLGRWFGNQVLSCNSGQLKRPS